MTQWYNNCKHPLVISKNQWHYWWKGCCLGRKTNLRNSNNLWKPMLWQYCKSCCCRSIGSGFAHSCPVVAIPLYWAHASPMDKYLARPKDCCRSRWRRASRQASCRNSQRAPHWHCHCWDNNAKRLYCCRQLPKGSSFRQCI